MIVKDVIKCALGLIGREDVLEKWEKGEELTEEQRYVTGVLLCCYNAVEDELARRAFVIKREERVTAVNGRVYYTSLQRAPLRILSVKKNGVRTLCRVFAEYLSTEEGSVDVTYICSPCKKGMEDSCEWGVALREELPAYGVVAEYYLVTGMGEEAEHWETKYVTAIRDAKDLNCPAAGRIPVRRWI